MNLSAKGLSLIQEFESYLKAQPDGSCKAYKCPAGVWTIGYGCTEGVTADAHWTRAEADAAFAREMVKHEKTVQQLVTVSITQSQFDALVSFSYNVGSGTLAKSTLLRKLNKKDYVGAADEFRHFTKALDPKTNKKVVLKGLVRRRKAESALFTADMPGADEMPQAAVESRPISAVVADNAATIRNVVLGTGIAGGGATVATQPAAPPPKPIVAPKETVSKARETAKEIRENVEVAKDYYSWARPTALAAWENAYVVGPLIAVAGLAIFWPKVKERLPWG